MTEDDRSVTSTTGEPDRDGEHRANGGRGIATTAGVAGLFLLIRVLSVSGWDWHTASLVAETVDTDDIAPLALGTLFSEPVITSVLLAVLLPILLVDVVVPDPRRRGRRPSYLLFAGGLVALAAPLVITFSAWWLVITVVVATLALALVRVRLRPGPVRRALLRATRSVGVLGATGALVLATFVTTPWVSEERIDTSDGALTGWVLRVQSGYLTVLQKGSRQVVIVPSSEVEQRSVLD